MVTSGAQVVGLRDAIRALEGYADDAEDLDRAMDQIGAGIVRHARPAVKTGALAGTVQQLNGLQNKAAVRAGGGSVTYAGVNNYGDPARNIPASHFLNAAADAIEPQVLPTVAAELKANARKHNLT